MVEQVTHPEGSPVVIEVWSDLGCPWCYIGKYGLQTAIAQRPDADRFKIVIRSFELNPAAPKEPETIEKAFIRTHGGTAAHVMQAERQIQALARKEGLEFTLDRLSANTFDLHRVVQYANDEGRGFEFFSRVQDGFFAGPSTPTTRMPWPMSRSRSGWTGSEFTRSSRAMSTPTACAPTGAKAWSWALPACRSLSSTAGSLPRARRRSRSTASCWNRWPDPCRASTCHERAEEQAPVRGGSRQRMVRARHRSVPHRHCR